MATELVSCSARSGFFMPSLAQAVTAERSTGQRVADRPPHLPGHPETTVLLVDDAHLLDDASAELLCRAAAGGEASVVATRAFG
jgi:hypothetical protein